MITYPPYYYYCPVQVACTLPSLSTVFEERAAVTESCKGAPVPREAKPVWRDGRHIIAPLGGTFLVFSPDFLPPLSPK